MQKRFYWLKLRNNFFTDPKIKKMRRIAGGDTYTLIYLEMQLLSLENEGKLYFQGLESTFEEELALCLDEDVENVKVTVSFLKSYGLIEERMEESEFLLTDVTKAIGTEGMSTERVRNFRQRQKQQFELDDVKTLQCNTSVTPCNKSNVQSNDIRDRDRYRDRYREELDTDKEKELYIEREKEKEKKADSLSNIQKAIHYDSEMSVDEQLKANDRLRKAGFIM